MKTKLKWIEKKNLSRAVSCALLIIHFCNRDKKKYEEGFLLLLIALHHNLKLKNLPKKYWLKTNRQILGKQI